MPAIFNLIAKLIAGFRIRWDYPGFEREARQAHLLDADRKYDTSSLTNDIAVRTAEFESSARLNFTEPSNDLIVSRNAAQSVREEAERKLRTLNRQYESEIDALSAELKELFAWLKTINNELSSAFRNREATKKELDAWYSRASGKSLFTHRDRKLPQNSFFGQNIAQKDRLKAKHLEAGVEIGNWKDQRQRMYDKINSVKSNIACVKAAREEMYQLLNSGFDHRLLVETINNMTEQAGQLGEQIAEFAAAKARFLAAELAPLAKLRAEIAAINSDKAKYIAEFDAPEAKQRRASAHRADWLVRHN